ncbi:hypothetical protein LTR09_004996 [Extremus antarcticus]|uniref:Uncharacterized protein n=1 Tax=Extremus antarcticus TaxID=702011 RepID=A0AAJ0G9B0_9PEZI|nr:hypothetical protein LTR09_004996 [Extremus antarcticus]
MRPSSEDNTPRSSGFFRLPVEIRLAIYEINIESEIHEDEVRSSSTVGRLPAQPPITQVYRVIRDEALDIWYSTARFPIQFQALKWPGNRSGAAGTPEYIAVERSRSIPYADTRRLEPCFVQTYGMNALHYRYFVNLDGQNDSYMVEHAPKTHEWWVGYRPWSSEAHKQAKHRAIRLRKCFDEAVAEMITSSGGVNMLTAQSFQHLTPRWSWKFGADLSGDLGN